MGRTGEEAELGETRVVGEVFEDDLDRADMSRSDAESDFNTRDNSSVSGPRSAEDAVGLTPVPPSDSSADRECEDDGVDSLETPSSPRVRPGLEALNSAEAARRLKRSPASLSASISRPNAERLAETADRRVEVALVGVKGASSLDPPAHEGSRSLVKDVNWSRAVAVEGPGGLPKAAPASRTVERQVVLMKRQVETAETTSRTDEQQVELPKQQVEDPDKCDVCARLDMRR